MTNLIRKFTVFLFLVTAGILFLSLLYDIWNPYYELSNRVFPALFTLFVAILDALAIRYLLSSRRMSFARLLSTTLLFFLSAIMASFVVTADYVDYRLRTRTYSGVYNDCFKVWAARGLVLEGPQITHTGNQNSIESIQRAFDRGARGTEVDIHFDVDRGEYIVAHDKPYNLKNGALLTLEDLFEATTESQYFWLDLKKVRRLDENQLAQAVKELERIAQTKDLKRRIYVEGEAPFSLVAFRDAGFNTIFDTHPLPDSNLLTPAIINLYKIFYYLGGFSVMAMNYGDRHDPFYGSRTRQSMGQIPVFLYHVDDIPDLLSMISKIPAVRVILVLDHSVNRYSLNSCPG